MTCHDAREQLSAVLDDALPGPERATVDAHLATCPDCRRVLEQLRGTVSLLGRLGPAHAPAGFVDRVVTQAYRPSRTRRVLDTLFRPLRVKLPLEAVAVLLVGVSALYVYERTPAVRQLARQEAPSPAPAVPAAPPVSGMAGAAPAAQVGAARAKVAPAEQELAREGTTPAPPPAVAPPATPIAPAPASNAVEAPGARANAKSAPLTDLRSEAPPTAKPELKPDVKADVKKEAQVEERRDASGAPSAPAGIEKFAKSAEPSPSRDAVSAHTGAAPAPPEAAPPSAAPVPAPTARGRLGGLSAATPATPTPEGAADAATAKSRAAAARLMRAADASGRLVVPASEPAEIALDALLSRLGATRVARRIERSPGPILIDVIVPVARYHELLEGLGRIGRWTTDLEPKAFPLQVRLEVAITVEP